MTTAVAATPTMVQAGTGPLDHPRMQIHGSHEERFGPVRDLFAEHFNRGLDIGASLAVFIDGQPVVDLWGGYTDREFTRPWQRDSIVNTFSSTKTMTALSALVAADRGLIDLDAPVARYWPEFAANGKQDVLVRHVLSHTAGLPGWTTRITLTDLYDWEKSTALLAAQAPMYPPGSAWAYHGLTMGHLVGEVIRRATGSTLGDFFETEIARPLGASYHISTWADSDLDVVPIIAGTPRARPGAADHEFLRALFNPWWGPDDANTLAWRRAELGGANGHGNGYAIAAIQAVLANGGVSLGTRIMSEAGCLRVLDVQADNACLCTGLPVRMGMGYGLASPVLLPDLTTNRVAFWGGSGGSLSFVDLDLRMSVGYTPNHWIEGRCESERRYGLLKALYAILDR